MPRSNHSANSYFANSPSLVQHLRRNQIPSPPFSHRRGLRSAGVPEELINAAIQNGARRRAKEHVQATSKGCCFCFDRFSPLQLRSVLAFAAMKLNMDVLQG